MAALSPLMRSHSHVNQLRLYVITHADGSRVSTTIIRLCDSVRRTIKPKRLKLKLVHHDTSSTNEY